VNNTRELDYNKMKRKKHLFRIGLILIGISFLVYPFYLYIPALPFTVKDKGVIFVASSMLSWGAFGCGTVLSGKEGYPYLKSFVRKLW